MGRAYEINVRQRDKRMRENINVHRMMFQF
jgi:hypothetical protein